ncbi:hypothetical protein [Hymenobacter norwichensis]|uniref:hypothetical protein n=1 Tax=Hymenobacter norwichensis TaxID=223903 RepID=UPI0003B4BE2A|nr:hypothetical protein [Hymenobacter norwichensis]
MPYPVKKRLVLLLLISFVVLDLGYTFLQAYQLPLEGDLPAIVLPHATCQQVLQDPFGWAVLTRNEVYVAPNRFFAHAAMVTYFKSVPFALQRLVSPISSVYAACALFAVAVQALLLYVLGVYISGTYSLRAVRLWLAAALLAPLFQLAGYNDQMGIVDHSITYTFFYAFPMALLLLLLLPFYRAAYQGQPLRLNWPRRLALIGLMVVLAFNGAIITGVVAVLFFGIVMHWLMQHKQKGNYFRAAHWLTRLRQTPRQPVVLLGLFTLLCLYSLFIGINEKESHIPSPPLWERYLRIPLGIFWQFRKLGLPLLLLACLANVQFIRRLLPATATTERLVRILKWVGLFALVYVLLLPLGGYREYRPLIVRRDSDMPIVLCLMFFYGLSTCFLLTYLHGRSRRWYTLGVLLFSAIFLNANKPWLKENNTCERQSLVQLAQARESVVPLCSECNVVDWGRTETPENSETAAQMLHYWNITPEKKLYFTKCVPHPTSVLPTASTSWLNKSVRRNSLQ